MFKLMMPSGHAAPYRLEGPVGGAPDRAILGLREEFHRSTLPPFLDGMVFNPVDFPGAAPNIQNFYHLGDFFVVSNTMKDFLETHAGCTFEARTIRAKHQNVDVPEKFWAMKVTTRIECILSDESFARETSWIPESRKSFRELATNVKLAEDIAPFFANSGADAYYSYPGFSIDDVSMDFSPVPKELKLFEPLYWPRYLVIDSAFALQLELQCRGGAMGYYFWTLGFSGVDKQYRDTMVALR